MRVQSRMLHKAEITAFHPGPVFHQCKSRSVLLALSTQLKRSSLAVLLRSVYIVGKLSHVRRSHVCGGRAENARMAKKLERCTERDVGSQKIVYTSRFVRVILAQGPC